MRKRQLDLFPVKNVSGNLSNILVECSVSHFIKSRRVITWPLGPQFLFEKTLYIQRSL